MSKQNEQATKKCKHCQSDIPKKAKVCPVCKKRQGNKLGVLLIIVGVLIVFAALSGDSNDTSTTTKETTSEATITTAESTEQSEFHLGETAEYKDVRVTLTNVTESSGSQFNTPTDGNIFVIVEFEIENNSDHELAISSMLSFSAYQDGYATNLSITALAEKEGEQLDGTVAPGKKMKGSVGYEIPEAYKELEIQFTPDYWAGKKITFVYDK